MKSIRPQFLPLVMSGAALVLAGAAPQARAHPGDHGADWMHAVMHLLSEPDHLVAIALALAVAVWGVRAFLRRR